jgi:ParB family chromosome partitioning protein
LVQRRVAAGVLSAGHARALLGLDNPAQVEQLAQRIVAEGLSVRAVEEIVTLTNSGDTASTTHKTASTSQANPAIQALAGRLADRFDTRVKVLMGKSKGRLTVEFASPEDLNRILALMAPDIKGVDQAG